MLNKAFLDRQKAYLASLERCPPEADKCEPGPSQSLPRHVNETHRVPLFIFIQFFPAIPSESPLQRGQEVHTKRVPDDDNRRAGWT